MSETKRPLEAAAVAGVGEQRTCRNRLTDRYVTGQNEGMGLSNAERQQRYRDRRKEQQPRIHYRRPQDRRSRPQRWREVAEKLETICEYDFGNLETLEPPRGFGRD